MAGDHVNENKNHVPEAEGCPMTVVRQTTFITEDFAIFQPQRASYYPISSTSWHYLFLIDEETQQASVTVLT